MTSKYCNCCAGIVNHICNHYDPSALIECDESAQSVLDKFRESFPGECLITLSDVEEYLESIR